MSVAYQSIIGQPLSVDISTDISVECWSTYQPTLNRYVGQYADQHILVDVWAECRSICRPICQSSIVRYVDRYISRVSVKMSTDIHVCIGWGVHKIHMIHFLVTDFHWLIDFSFSIISIDIDYINFHWLDMLGPFTPFVFWVQYHSKWRLDAARDYHMRKLRVY